MVTVNSLWIGKELSTLENLSIKSHLANGHQYNLWCYEEINAPEGVNLKDGNMILPAAEIFSYQIGEGKGSVSAFSNLFRYKLLCDYGGWWVDTDVIALKPFDFQSEYVFATERGHNGLHATTCVIKCPQGNEFIKDCYSQAAQHDRETLQWGTIGPRLLAQMVQKWSLMRYLQSAETFCPVNWFDSEFDAPIHFDPNLEKSYAVHMWNEMWRRKSVDKNKCHDENTLYERLKRRYLCSYPENRRDEYWNSIRHL